ncbi:MAG TPA: Uma2 family endonuclease [Phycisphaerae bacterium]|nr:Uma2 family endonuclease [Phycisphaerae bacterium]
MTIAESQLPQVTPQQQPTPYRFTREEYYRMGDLGIFHDKRVELIEGEIIYMPPMKDLHAVAIGLVGPILANAFPDFWVRNQLPLAVAKKSDPVPDFSVTPGNPRDYLGKPHPHTALLVIEIADSTLAFDRNTKASLYARAAVLDYWILNLRDRSLEVYRDPVTDPDAPLGHRYQSLATLHPPAIISPLAAPAAQIPVADLLP